LDELKQWMDQNTHMPSVECTREMLHSLVEADAALTEYLQEADAATAPTPWALKMACESASYALQCYLMLMTTMCGDERAAELVAEAM
jgi:hypothetical protein